MCVWLMSSLTDEWHRWQLCFDGSTETEPSDREIITLSLWWACLFHHITQQVWTCHYQHWNWATHSLESHSPCQRLSSPALWSPDPSAKGQGPVDQSSVCFWVPHDSRSRICFTAWDLRWIDFVVSKIWILFLISKDLKGNSGVYNCLLFSY